MSFAPADARLLGDAFRHPELVEPFSDAGTVRRMIAVERALARAGGRAGVLPAEAADGLDRELAAVDPDAFDWLALGRRAQRDGVPVPALLAALRERLTAESAHWLHWGATSQDVMDTALVLQVRDALPVLRGALGATVAALADAAARHRDLPMVGRTHGRAAAPITFGLAVAAWLAPLVRYTHRLEDLAPRLQVLQFGGSVGTLAALGSKGPALREALAHELRLALRPMPWHTQRDLWVELGGWLAGVGGSLAKMAQDVILLGTDEVAELRDAPDAGGSSTLPHKRNPIRCEYVLAAARANAGLMSNLHHAQVQEHQRGTHGWQLEWTALPQLVAHAGAALAHAAEVAAQLEPDADRMRANLEARGGVAWSEAASFALAPHLGRSEAARRVGAAAQTARAEDRHLLDVLRQESDAPVDWDALRDPRAVTGSAGAFVDAVVAEARTVGS